MIFGRHKAVFERKSQGKLVKRPIPLRLLRAGLPLLGLTGGWLSCAAALWLPTGNALASATDAEQLLTAAGSPHIARELPENTPYAMFFSTQADGLAALEQFELFSKISNETGGLVSQIGLPFLSAESSFGFEGPFWAGEQSAIALLPETTPGRLSPLNLDNQFYSISEIEDTEAFARFVEGVEVNRDVEPEESTYQGASLWTWPEQDGATFEFEEDLGMETSDRTISGLTIAQVGDYAVMSPSLQSVKEVIDYQQESSNLAENDLFARSQYAQQPNALLHLYANLSETSKFNLKDLFEERFAALPMPSEIPGLPPLPAMPDLFSVESRLLAARLTDRMTVEAIAYPQPEGLRFQGRLYGNQVIQPTATPDLPYADSAIQYVPAPAYTLGSGRNPAGFWQRVAGFFSAEETARGFLDQARLLAFTLTGLDLDTELIGWMDQEVVFFSFPSDRGLINEIFPGAGIELGLALQTSDRAQAEETLSALSKLAQEWSPEPFSVDTLVNEQPAVNWRIPSDGENPAFSLVGQSWMSEDTVMFTSGIGGMERLLNASAFEPLDEHPTFLNATRSLANPNNGYSYINASSSLSLIYGFVQNWFNLDPNNPFFVEVKSYLGTVRGLGGTTSSTADYWQLDSLITLAPVQREVAPPQVKLELAE